MRGLAILFSSVMVVGLQDPAKFPDSLHREVLEELKAGTVLVEVRGPRGYSTGSGFIVTADGHILTNKHVVEGSGSPPEFHVMLHSGTPSQKRYKAERIQGSTENDLALLKIDAKDLKPLVFGNANELSETVTLWAFGFPLGNLFRDAEKGPEMTINKGNVTALRRAAGGGLELIQVDAQVNPGNSGGPLVSGDGRVYGVITFAIRESTLRFAIPSTSVWSFLDPKVLGSKVKTPRIPPQGGSIEVEAQVRETAVKAAEVTAVVWVGSAQNRFKLNREEGIKGMSTWKGAWDCPPIGTADLDRLEAKLTTRTKTTKAFAYRAGNLELKTTSGAEAVTVEPGVRIELGASGQEDKVVDAKGTREGRLKGEGIDTGTEIIPWGQVESIRFSRISRPYLDVQVTVTIEGRTIRGSITKLYVAAAGGSEEKPKERPATLTEAMEKVLPGRLESAKLGYGGRYLLLHLKALGTLAVFDVQAMEVIKHIPLQEGEVLFASGRHHLLICYPEASRLERWNQETLTRETVIETPFQGKASVMELGWDSEGPAVTAVQQSPEDTSLRLVLFDPAKLKLLDVQSRDARGFSDFCSIRPNASGSHFAWWSSRSSSTAGTFRVAGTRVFHGTSNAGGSYVVPSEDGMVAFTSTGLGEILESTQRTRSTETPQVAVVPAVEGPFYLELQSPDAPGGSKAVVNASLHLLTNRSQIASLDFPVLDQSIPQSSESGLSADRRIWLFPGEKVLITVPKSNDRLVCRPINVGELLDQSGVEYLYVASRPPTSAEVGLAWSYSVAVKSRVGGLKVVPENLPEGMTHDSKQMLSWTPRETGTSTVILRLSDSSGQELYHTFRITVRSAKK